MLSSKLKSLVVVFVLLVFTGFVTVGCKQKAENKLVNTSSMPGQTFSKHSLNSQKTGNSGIIYLGSGYDTPKANFGPRDVSFDFKSLR